MEYLLTFHPSVQRDLNEIIDYYQKEAGSHIAALFEKTAVDKFSNNRKNLSALTRTFTE